MTKNEIIQSIRNRLKDAFNKGKIWHHHSYTQEEIIEEIINSKNNEYEKDS